MSDIKPSELENIEFAFNVYGSQGILDCFYLGKLCRVLNLNPSLETLEKHGATKKEGEKTMKFDEFLPVYSALKKEKKDQGCYEDFIECLKLYDKNEDGHMMGSDLYHSLSNLGEKLPEDELDEVLEDCLDEEDDEGQIEYTPFLRRMCELDPPLKPKKAAPPKK
ncbi:unnamed protein product [Brassicogethes aeneus]|uniref:Myosin light chain alkali n=1 Tax=Brassicogethes aeneus TaxID=1431903 RepID=A0A9P0B1P3_BRAAE|nr:unnamed protein product [Brassicogethes aeneus]